VHIYGFQFFGAAREVFTKRVQLLFTTVAFLLVSSTAFAQAGNASAGGFVQDASQLCHG